MDEPNDWEKWNELNYELKCIYVYYHILSCHFQTKSEKEEYLALIRQGLLDIIVGTHALLGTRVVYNNLGLLVVDEEQVC